MFVQTKNRADFSALPTDVTRRAALLRRQGIIASLIAAVVTLSANRRLRRASKRYRSGNSPPVPDYLRADVGLPPLPRQFDRIPNPWQFRP